MHMKGKKWIKRLKILRSSDKSLCYNILNCRQFPDKFEKTY